MLWETVLIATRRLVDRQVLLCALLRDFIQSRAVIRDAQSFNFLATQLLQLLARHVVILLRIALNVGIVLRSDRCHRLQVVRGTAFTSWIDVAISNNSVLRQISLASLCILSICSLSLRIRVICDALRARLHLDY